MEFENDFSLKEWAKDKPLSILQLDPADRAVLRIAVNIDEHIAISLFGKNTKETACFETKRTYRREGLNEIPIGPYATKEGNLLVTAASDNRASKEVKKTERREMECIHESDEEEEDKFEINPLVSHPMPKLTTQRSHTNMNHPSVRTIGMPRAKTCDKPLQEFEKNAALGLGLTTAASVGAMQRVNDALSSALDPLSRYAPVLLKLRYVQQLLRSYEPPRYLKITILSHKIYDQISAKYQS
ncbi:hypothetical protein RR48_02646 [Papilio machaon]|uniref:Uncharacterized protein n=1 Tax=Papilio machaon TaxID=76193 RepID=A0A0N1I9I6_PAPMA|nr:hypothetical protein RR48_02646 [Papilio machaon]